MAQAQVFKMPVWERFADAAIGTIIGGLIAWLISALLFTRKIDAAVAAKTTSLTAAVEAKTAGLAATYELKATGISAGFETKAASLAESIAATNARVSKFEAKIETLVSQTSFEKVTDRLEQAILRLEKKIDRRNAVDGED